MNVEGKIVHVPLSGGVYMLETRDGRRYALKGGDDGLRQEGQSVSVKGNVDGGGAPGIGMTGDLVLEVDAYQVLDQ